MEWEVKYYLGSLPLSSITSSEMSWENLPIENVIFVMVKKDGMIHTLKGYDNYWVNGNEYGCFNNTGQLAIDEETNRLLEGYTEIQYEGLMDCYYNWDDDCRFMGEKSDKNGLHILKGVMIPDDEARQIGLI